MKIAKSYHEISSYLSEVQEAADSDREALGFLPASAYREQAQRGRLWIVSTEDGYYVGHLLFGGRFPQLTVSQVYVRPEYRKRGIARRLINELVDYGEENSFYSIKARVADNLPANEFWQSVGFDTQRKEAGGATTRRRINVRFRNLNVPTLFDFAGKSFRSFPKGKLTYDQIPSLGIPKFAIDLNVVMDVAKDRDNGMAAVSILRSSAAGQISLVLTPEVVEELRRAKIPHESNPLLKMIEALPVLPKVDEEIISGALSTLRGLVFPGRSLERTRAAQDLSDLRHLALSAHHGLDGFITSDKALLRASEKVKSAVEIEILSPHDFSIASDTPSDRPSQVVVQMATCTLVLKVITEDERAAAEDFLRKQGVGQGTIRTVLQPSLAGAKRERIGGWVGDELIGIGSWDVPPAFTSEVNVFLFVVEEAPEAVRFIDHVLESASLCIPVERMKRIVLHYLDGQLTIVTTAQNRGFQSSPGSVGGLVSVVRIAYTGLVHQVVWEDFRKEFQKLSAVKLPQKMPTKRRLIKQGLVVQGKGGGETFVVDKFDFDTALSPGMLLPPGLDGIIAPIQRGYAAELLAGAVTQRSLVFDKEAHIRLERAYFRSPMRTRLFEKGVPILFYESGAQGGEMAVIASARVTATMVGSVDEVQMRYSRQGVLDKRQLEGRANKKGQLHVFAFDGLLRCEHRVPFELLKYWGCVSGANLTTIEPITHENLLLVNRFAVTGSVEES